MIAWMMQNAVVAGALAAVVATLCRLFRLSPPLRHALWLIVMLKLVTPPLVSWRWTTPDVPRYLSVVIPRSDRSLVGLNERRGGFAESTARLRTGDKTMELGRHAKIGSTEASTGQSETTAGFSIPRRDAPAWLCIWLLGTLTVAAWQMTQILRFRRQLTRGQRAPQLETLASGVAEQLGVRCPKVIVLARARQPFLWCFGRLTLVWPATCGVPFNGSSSRSILAHELAHLRRRDHWICWLTLAAGWIWWWYPLYWIVKRNLEQNAELSCDAWAVWLYPGSRQAYAESLVEVWKQGAPAIGPAPAFITRKASRKLLERRLTMIMRANTPRKLSVGRAFLLALAAAVALPLWAAAPGEGDRPKEGDRKVRVGPREGEVRKEAAPREGEALPVKEEAPREGDRKVRVGPRDGEVRKEAAPREGEALPVKKEAPREGDRKVRVGPRDGEIRKEGAPREGDREALPVFNFKPETPREAELYKMILQLQRELISLRRELNQIKGPKGDQPLRDRERPLRDGERPAREGDRVVREGDRPLGDRVREGDRPRDGDRPAAGNRREGDAPPEGAPPVSPFRPAPDAPTSGNRESGSKVPSYTVK